MLAAYVFGNFVELFVWIIVYRAAMVPRLQNGVVGGASAPAETLHMG
jgi:hypothetical protein